MRAILSTIMFSVMLITFALSAQAAVSVSNKDLQENADKYDGKTIVFKGEVIGDILIRGESAWINVQDETGTIGVFCLKESTADIEYCGGYKYKGDIVSVKGTFHSHCLLHAGDTDIHADTITIIKKGEEIAHPLDPQKVKTSITLGSIVFVLAIIHLLVRRFR